MIEYRGVFRFDADRETLWRAVSAIDSFPRWAPWLHDLERTGEWPEPGTIITFDVVSPLPYRLNLLVSAVTTFGTTGVIMSIVRGRIEGVATDLAAKAHTDTTTSLANRRGFRTAIELSAAVSADWSPRSRRDSRVTAAAIAGSAGAAIKNVPDSVISTEVPCPANA